MKKLAFVLLIVAVFISLSVPSLALERAKMKTVLVEGYFSTDGGVITVSTIDLANKKVTLSYIKDGDIKKLVISEGQTVIKDDITRIYVMKNPPYNIQEVFNASGQKTRQAKLIVSDYKVNVDLGPGCNSKGGWAKGSKTCFQGNSWMCGYGDYWWIDTCGDGCDSSTNICKVTEEYICPGGALDIIYTSCTDKLKVTISNIGTVDLSNFMIFADIGGNVISTSSNKFADVTLKPGQSKTLETDPIGVSGEITKLRVTTGGTNCPGIYTEIVSPSATIGTCQVVPIPTGYTYLSDLDGCTQQAGWGEGSHVCFGKGSWLCTGNKWYEKICTCDKTTGKCVADVVSIPSGYVSTGIGECYSRGGWADGSYTCFGKGSWLCQNNIWYEKACTCVASTGKCK